MHITELRIRNFRSIDDLTIPLDRFTTFCGPNSCGKSNIFRAIQLAFQSTVSVNDAQSNLPTTKLVQGGPKLSIWVDCKFDAISNEVQALAGVALPSADFSFRLTRGGTLTRKLGAKVLTQAEFEHFLSFFLPVYVPPIRDLSGDGLLPFRQLIKAALQRAKGPGNIKQVSDAAKKLIEKKAGVLLDQQTTLAKRILRADKLSLDTSGLDIEALYENIGLRVHIGESEQPLSSLGTGHQSAVIMHLYRQLGEDMPGEVLYLFEEPDNHLHPSTIRSICDDLRGISTSSQVLVSTHSPVFLAHVGFPPLRPLVQTIAGITERRKMTLLNHYTEKQARAHLESFGLRITEPLLCRRVIVVEGPTDKIALSTLFERRTGTTTDQSDLLVIAAGSKDRAVILSHLLGCLGVDWRCVLDRDAAYSSEVPYSKVGLAGPDINNGIAAIDTLNGLLDTSKKRGSNAANSLAAIRHELATARPVPQLLEGSPLKTLIIQGAALNLAEQNQLKIAMATNRKRESWALLAKARVFVWSSTLEGVLLHNAAAENRVEAELVAVGELAAPLAGSPTRGAALNNKLHGTGYKPEVLARVVSALEDDGHFKRTEMNECFARMFGD